MGCPTPLTNLADAAAGENYEWTDMYAQFAATAREEGFDHIAYLFEHVGAIERSMRRATASWPKGIKNGTVFARQTEQVWICTNCGHIHVGTPPEKCPVRSSPGLLCAARSKLLSACWNRCDLANTPRNIRLFDRCPGEWRCAARRAPPCGGVAPNEQRGGWLYSTPAV